MSASENKSPDDLGKQLKVVIEGGKPLHEKALKLLLKSYRPTVQKLLKLKKELDIKNPKITTKHSKAEVINKITQYLNPKKKVVSIEEKKPKRAQKKKKKYKKEAKTEAKKEAKKETKKEAKKKAEEKAKKKDEKKAKKEAKKAKKKAKKAKKEAEKARKKAKKAKKEAEKARKEAKKEAKKETKKAKKKDKKKECDYTSVYDDDIDPRGYLLRLDICTKTNTFVWPQISVECGEDGNNHVYARTRLKKHTIIPFFGMEKAYNDLAPPTNDLRRLYHSLNYTENNGAKGHYVEAPVDSRYEHMKPLCIGSHINVSKNGKNGNCCVYKQCLVTTTEIVPYEEIIIQTVQANISGHYESVYDGTSTGKMCNKPKDIPTGEHFERAIKGIGRYIKLVCDIFYDSEFAETNQVIDAFKGLKKSASFTLPPYTTTTPLTTTNPDLDVDQQSPRGSNQVDATNSANQYEVQPRSNPPLATTPLPTSPLNLTPSPEYIHHNSESADEDVYGTLPPNSQGQNRSVPTTPLSHPDQSPPELISPLRPDIPPTKNEPHAQDALTGPDSLDGTPRVNTQTRRIKRRPKPTARQSRKEIRTVGFGDNKPKKHPSKPKKQQKAHHVLGQLTKGQVEDTGEKRIRESENRRYEDSIDRDRERDRNLDRESFNYSPKAIKTIVNSLNDLQHLNKHPVATDAGDDGDESYSPNKPIGVGDTSEYEPDMPGA